MLMDETELKGLEATKTPAKSREQALLEEFTEVSPVFNDVFLLPFLTEREILTNKLLTNLKSLVSATATYNGYNNNPKLINTRQGVLNIDNNELEARNGRLFDRILPEYAPTATAPAFMKLLKNYDSDEYPTLSKDLLNLFAYQLFGNNSLKTFFIAHGNGDNAKSTLWRLVENALGSTQKGGYATKVDSETFIASSKSFNVGLTQLNNSRFIYSDEIKQGVELDGTLIKQVVAGEGSTIEFNEKQNKNQAVANIISPVVLLLNDIPNFKNADEATINRVALIEFKKQFVRNDPEAKRLIDEAMHEQAGIFNMILGAYNPDWEVPERWRADALEVVDSQTFDDDVTYHLEQALLATVYKTGDTRDRVRRAELHAELDRKYYQNKGMKRPTKRELEQLLPRQDVGVSGNDYTKVILITP